MSAFGYLLPHLQPETLPTSLLLGTLTRLRRHLLADLDAGSSCRNELIAYCWKDFGYFLCRDGMGAVDLDVA